MKRNMILMLVITGIIFGAIFGYHAFGNYMMKKYFASAPVPPVTVATVKAVVEPWQPKIRAVGDLRCARSVQITTEVPGQVEKVYFRPAEVVKAGDILLELNADTDIAQEKVLAAALDLARSIYERDVKQLKIQAVSQALIDQDMAEVRIREAQLEQQKALRAKKIIRAPFSGVLGLSSVSPGRYLSPGEPVVNLEDPYSMRVDFFIPQKDMARLKTGQSVTVRSETWPGRVFEGRITAFNSQVERDSRNIRVEAEVANTKAELVAGMFVTVEVETGEPQDRVTIPQTCVSFNPYGETVYLVEEEIPHGEKDPVLIARQTFIKTGVSRGDQVAVLEGLKAGDRVVSAGQHKLKNGSVITVNNQVQPSNDPAPEPREE
jgi:membrane fusion protein (multidrug efflux system)